MPLKLKKIKGSSIIEVVTGIFIISLSIALTGVLFAGVFTSSSRIKKQRAWFHMNQWGNEIMLTHNIINEEVEYPSFKMIKESEILDEENNLWVVRIRAVESKGEVISQRKFIIEVTEPE